MVPNESVISRPDDEGVRSVTIFALSVIGSSLGVRPLNAENEGYHIEINPTRQIVLMNWDNSNR